MHQSLQIGHCRYLAILLILCALITLNTCPSEAKTDYLALCRAADATDRMRVEACGFAGHDPALSAEDRALALARRGDTILAQLKHEPNRFDLRDIVRADLEEARRLAPENADIQRSFVDFNNHWTGKVDNQLAAIGSLMNQEGEDPGLLLQRGIAYFRQGQIDKALADVTRATELDPQNVEAFVVAGQLLTNQMRNDESVKAFTQALALAPDRKDIRLQRIGPAVVAQQFEIAKEDGEKGLTGKNAEAQLWDLLGVAHYALGDYQAASKDFSTQLQLDDLSSRSLVWRFLSDYRAGAADVSTAVKKARELDDHWPSAVLAHFAGSADAAAVLAQAGASPQELRATRIAQAHFYLAEWALMTKGPPAFIKEHLAASAAAGVAFGSAQTTLLDEPVVINDNNILEMSMTTKRLHEVGP